MTEFLQLLAVFAGIYLFDCVHWARRETVAFRTWWRSRVRVVAGEDMPGNDSFGVVFAQPLLPFGRLFLTQTFPLSLTRDVAVSFVAHATNPGPRAGQIERAVRFEPGLAVTTEARRVSIGGRVFVEAGSERMAQRLANLIVDLGTLAPHARAKRIDELVRAAFDTRAIAQRVDEFTRATRALLVACTCAFWFVFAVTPIVGLRFGLAQSWIPLVAALVVGQVAILWTFVRAHRRLYASENGARIGQSILLALSPPAAMRAVEALSRDLLAEFHPLAVAAVVLERDAFADLVESTLRDAVHPLPIRRDGDDPLVHAADLEWRERMLTALEAFASREGIAPARWRAAPARLEADCLSYCPRCTQQFTLASGTCARCWDLELESLSGS